MIPILFTIQSAIPSVYAQNVAGKASETGKASGQAIDQLLKFLWDKIDNWIAALAVAAVGFFLAKMIQTAVVDRISEHVDEEHQDVLVLVGRATYIAVLAVAMTIALKVAGIDITTIIAAVGFGIGFALQDLISNFISGIMILISRQFNLGDFILVNNTIGQIKEIQSRCTVLQALDGTKVIVPNKDLFVNQVISYTTNPFRRVDIPVGVDYSTDLQKAASECLRVMQEHPNTLKQPPSNVLIDSFGESSINLIARFWVESKSNWLGIKSEITINIKKAFDAAHISIPFPIRTLHITKEEREISHAMENAGIAPKMTANEVEVLSALSGNGQPQEKQPEIEVKTISPEIKADIKEDNSSSNQDIPITETSNSNANTPLDAKTQDETKKNATSEDEGASFLSHMKSA